MPHKFFLSLLHTFLLEVTNPKEKKKVFTSWLKSSSTDISPDDWDPLLLPWSFLYHSVRAEWTFPVTNNVLFLWCSEMSCPQLASAMTSRVEVPDKCRKLPEWTPGWAPAGEPGFSHGPCDNSTPPHTGHLTSGEWEEAVWDCVWPLLSSVQFSCSVMSDSMTPWTAARQASLSITNSRGLLKLMSIESVMPSSHLILCHPLLLLPSIFPSIRVFSNESVLCIRWPEYWSFSFSISPSNEYLGLISFRMDWLDLLAVQGSLKGLRQHHSSKASILCCSAFFIVQLSHPYMTTGETIALTRQTFVGKVMSLIFNKLSRLVINFLPRSKHLLISWLQSPSSVI